MKKILNLLHENLVNILGGHGIEINIRGCHPTQGPHPISFQNNGILFQNDLLREKIVLATKKKLVQIQGHLKAKNLQVHEIT